MMFAVAAAAILVALALVITRGILGPTVFDRALAGNSVGTLAILLLAGRNSSTSASPMACST